MTTLQNTKPEVRKRAESLTRMLELEKKYKIQRLQDIGSTPPLTPLGATITRSASSAQPNPVLKARHASALPVAPRQRPHMMMKASRRASALPSLSISVPHPVSSAVAVRTDEPEAQATPEPIPQREASKDTAERTKTVTFSEPEGDEEDAELSDQSSICQSPSWAVYGQSKKKDKKREAAEKKKEDNRQEKANRKSFTRRLSKQPPPQSTPQGRPSLSGERSQSAPDLEQYQKLSDRNLSRSGSHYPPDSMIHHQNLLKQPAPAENSKPKSKGLFSGFRLPGNSSNNSQKTESSASARASMEDVSSLRAGSAYALHKSGARGDMDFLNPRKPPSIMSNSSSSQSHSSQELKQNKERRSSNHGRSNSLLSRLKGPSYLYAKHSDSSDEVTPKRPGSSEKTESAEERNAAIQNVIRAAPEPKVLGSIDQHEDKTIRGRQLQMQAQVLQPRDSSSDSELGNLVNAQNHQNSQQQVSEGPSGHDSRRRPQNRKLQSGGHHSGAPVPLLEPTSPRQFGHDELRSTRGRNPRRNFAHPSQPEIHVQHKVATSELPSPAMSPRSNKSYASVYTDAVDQLSESQSFHTEVEGNPPAHTNASAFQPESRKGGCDGLTANRTGGKPAVLFPSGHEQGELRRSPRVAEMRGQRTEPNRDDRSGEADMPLPTAVQAEDQVYRAPKPSDYFTFVSESYAPPSLELRSPVEDDFQEDETAEDIYEDEDLVWVTSTDGNEESEKSDRDHVEEHQTGGEARVAEVCDSPTLSAHDRESYVPPLDGMGVYSAVPSTLETNKPFRVTVEDDPSQTVSERSSSSTHNEPLHSPSTATTPDISRPQSQRGPSVDISRDRANDSRLLDAKPPKKLYRSKMAETSVPRPKGMDANRFGDGNTSSVDADHSDDTTRGGTPDHVLSRSSSSIRSPTLRAFAEPLLEEVESDEGPPRRQPLAPKAQSAIDLSTNGALLRDRHQPSALKRNKAAFSSVSLPSSPPPELETEAPPRLRSAMKMPRQDSSGSQDSSNIVSAGAAYLKEARKAAPTPGGSSSRSVRPMFTPRTSLGPPKTGSTDKKGDPMAKVLVQCCNCQFFHDMPSRVYECMAKPDSVIEDKLLGVSAAITTTVRCPWCAHGMTTTCCSGYAALVYLKEKLHGQ